MARTCAISAGRPKAQRRSRRSRQESVGTLTFINVSEPNESKDKNLQKIVRSSVMRTYSRHRKRETLTEQTQQPDIKSGKSAEPSFKPQIKDYRSQRGETIRDAQDLLDSFSQPSDTAEAPRDRQCFQAACSHKGCTSGLCEQLTVTPTHPQTLVGNGMGDPFSSYPYDGCHKHSSLVLNHFASVMARCARDCLPIDSGNGSNPLTAIWVPKAIADPLLFLVTLNYASVHLDTLRGHERNPKTLWYKGEAIELMKSRLQDETMALTDETIASVAMLAAMESLSGNYNELQIHADGLTKMVKMRGGLRALGWRGVLRMFISWQDIISSTMMAPQPSFDRMSCCTEKGDLPFLEEMASPASDLAVLNENCAGMATTFENLRQLTHFMTSCGNSVTTTNLMVFSSVRSSLGHRLFDMKIHKSAEDMTVMDYQLEACRIAALIYMISLVHNTGLHCPISQYLKEQLKALLLEGESKFVEYNRNLKKESLTWVMVLGGMLSVNEDERTWFAMRIAKLTRAWQSKGSQCWATLEDVFRQISWADCLRTSALTSLWNRVRQICDADLGWPDPCAAPHCPLVIDFWSPLPAELYE